MLTVIQLPPGKRYVSLYSVYAPTGRNSNFYVNAISTPVELDGTESGQTILSDDLGVISHSDRVDAFGDKPVDHHYYEGELIAIPHAATLTAASKDNLVPYYTSPCTRYSGYYASSGQSANYSTMISSGKNYIIEMPFDSREGSPIVGDSWGNVAFRCHRVGHDVVAGFILDRTVVESRGTFHYVEVCIDKLTFSSDWAKVATKGVMDSTSIANFEANKAQFYSELPETLTRAMDNSTSYQFTGSGVITKEKILSGFNTLQCLLTSSNYSHLVRSRYDIWGDLVVDCLNRLDYVNVNVIQFINELRHVDKLLPKIGSLLKPKTYASVYLWFKYGLSLTIQDIKALSSAVLRSYSESLVLKAQGPKKVYAQRSFSGKMGSLQYVDLYHYKITYERYPSEIMLAINDMTRWGVYPTLENAWDMVPFSFVVDWFLPINRLLEKLDTITQSQYYNVLAVCRSRKCSVSIPANLIFSDCPLLGSIQEVSYSRQISNHLDLPIARIEAPGTFSNYAELTALIVQLKR